VHHSRSIRIVFRTQRPIVRHLAITAALGVLSLSIAGCSSRVSADKALDQALKDTNTTKKTLAPFAGKVTVDGKPPVTADHHAFVVMLYDPKAPPSDKTPLLRTICDDAGNFAFGTYSKKDGVPTGSYVVLFANLKCSIYGNAGYHGPDTLNNLYNDPDRSEFKVDVAAPGKTDYVYDLKVDGKDPVNPGRQAITDIRQ
jgi:hypothetical protein